MDGVFVCYEEHDPVIENEISVTNLSVYDTLEHALGWVKSRYSVACKNGFKLWMHDGELDTEMAMVQIGKRDVYSLTMVQSDSQYNVYPWTYDIIVVWRKMNTANNYV